MPPGVRTTATQQSQGSAVRVQAGDGEAQPRRHQLRGGDCGEDQQAGAAARGRVGKNPGFFKKNQPSRFFVFLGFFGFFLVFLVFYIFAQKRGFLGFFSFKNTFRCIQTLNYNHSN